MLHWKLQWPYSGLMLIELLIEVIITLKTDMVLVIWSIPFTLFLVFLLNESSFTFIVQQKLSTTVAVGNAFWSSATLCERHLQVDSLVRFATVGYCTVGLPLQCLPAGNGLVLTCVAHMCVHVGGTETFKGRPQYCYAHCTVTVILVCLVLSHSAESWFNRKDFIFVTSSYIFYDIFYFYDFYFCLHKCSERDN